MAMASASTVGGVGKVGGSCGSVSVGFPISNVVVNSDVVMIPIKSTPYFSVFTNSSMLTGNFGFTSA